MFTCKRVFLIAALAWMAHAARAQQAAPLQTVPVEAVDFRELKLTDAARLLSEQTGLNISVSTDAGKVPVTLFLRNVPAKAALETLCKSHNLWFKEDADSGIIRIMTTQEFQRDLVNYREEKNEVFTLLYPNSTSIAYAIRDLFGDRVHLSLGREEDSETSRDLSSRFDRFDAVDQRGLFSLGAANGQVNTNSSSSYSNSSAFNASRIQSNIQTTDTAPAARRGDQAGQGNTAVRRDFGDDFRKLTPDQAELLQKLIEKGGSGEEFDAALEAFRSRAAAIYVTFNRRNNLIAVRTSDTQALAEIKALISRLDVPTPLVLLEVKILSLELDDGFNSVFDYQFSDGAGSAGGFSSGNIQPPPADLLKGAARTAAALTVGGTAVQSGNLIFQYVNQNFRARLQLLQQKNKVTTLATPMIVTANNEVSRLFVGEQRPIVQNISTQTVVNNNTVTSSPTTTFQYQPVGTTLLITPNINSDRTVTIRLLQENSSIEPNGATIPIVGNNGNVTNQPVDVVATRTVSGTVVAKDLLELAVGGLIQDNLADQRAKVPVIGNVPVIGFFFRRQSTSRSKQEMIVVIRPHIMSTPAESEAISHELLGDLSIHPSAPDPKGSLNTFVPREVLTPNPPENKAQDIMHLDNVKP